MALSNISRTLGPLPGTGQFSTAAANTAVVQTFTASTVGESNVLAQAVVSFSAASGTGTLIVADGGTTILSVDIALTAGQPFVMNFHAGLAGTANTAMTVTLSAGGAAAVGKLSTTRYLY